MNNNIRTRAAYTTDVSDTEWQIIEPHIPGQKPRGRKIEYSRREILNAIFLWCVIAAAVIAVS